MLWDYIVVGGGLAGSVLSNRLLKQDNSLRILVIEAGPNVNNRTDIVWPNSTNLIGGDFDWKYTTIAQANLNNRAISLPQGKALGGGTVINSGGWIRGDKVDYDLWGDIVGDSRWAYDGQLPFMKKTEHFWNDTINSDQHGFSGNVIIQSVTSTNRPFPLREYALQSWSELGITTLPLLDANAGDPLGVGELNENKHNGRREIAAAIYSLEGITVLTDTLVEKVILSKHANNGNFVATGVQLANGTQLSGCEIIVSAGAIRTPQILMLSGIGPADELARHGIDVKVDSPDVGKNLAEHPLGGTFWKVKNPEDGWALGSGNPLFSQEQYGWGTPADFLVSTTVPREGLIAAIEIDEGVAPDPERHPLLKENRTFIEHVFQYSGSTDGSAVLFGEINLLPTSRGSVTLASADINDAPLIDPNYLGTEVDRYVFREGLRLQVAFASSNATVIGRKILDGEIPAAGFDEPLSVASSDSYLDERSRAAIGSAFHPMGSAAMGKVVNTDLEVKGVVNLRVVDASVFPVAITAHLQVATYALAEQAAVIFASGMKYRGE